MNNPTNWLERRYPPETKPAPQAINRTPWFLIGALICLAIWKGVFA